MGMHSVVVTGIGLVTPLGLTAEEHRSRVCTMESGIGGLPAFAEGNRGCHAAARVAEFDFTESLRFPKSTKFMNRPVLCGMKAALEAYRSAGLAGAGLDDERLGVFAGSGNTCLEPDYFTGALDLAWADGKERDYKYLGGRPSRMIDRYFSLRTLSNGGVGLLSIEIGAKGPGANFVHGETASLMALQSAWYDIGEGRCDVALAGGYDCLVQPTTFLDFQVKGQLSKAEPACAYRPFDVNRDGLVPGEGGAFLVLEAREHAEKRRARILAEILAVDCRMSSEGEVAAELLDGRRPDFAVLRGLGTVEDDRAEYESVQGVLESVPSTALKSRTGYLGAGTAAAEFVLGLLAAREGLVPAVARLQKPDSECSLDLVMNEARPLARGTSTGLFLSSSLAGQAGGIVARVMEA